MFYRAGGDDAMPKLKFVLIVEGFAPDANCAIPELIEICQGYGLSVDLIKENMTGGE